MSRQRQSAGTRSNLFPLLFGALLAFLPGCLLPVSSGNPARVGNLPPGKLVRTHAKPPLRGFYHNFDPHAKSITLAPAEDVNPVRTQHVFVAAICDEQGNGLRNRRVEWHVSGVGHIVEVDESGLMHGRGYQVDDAYAVSYTNYRAHTLTRGNEDPSDDIQLKPGQTYCVVTSPVEGETHVTCYAPGIYDWNEHKAFAVKRWVDVEPIFPPCAVNPAGQPHPLTTRVVHIADQSPAPGYKVRYRIIDGPPAVLEPGGAAAIDATTDSQGAATVTLRQLQPVEGINRVCIEVVRPGDRPTDRELRIGCAEVTKTWLTPKLAIQKLAPPTAIVGQPIPYQITVTNTGNIATQGVTIRDTIPPGLTPVSSMPLASFQAPNLIWSFGALQPQQSVVVQFACTPTAPGVVTNCAEAVFAEGASGRACATTQVLAGGLTVAKSGPPTGVVGQPVTFQITVTNPGNAPATNVVVTDAFDQGFVHQTGSAPVRLDVGALGPGESRAFPIVLTPRVPGRLCNHVTATADGGLNAAAEHCVEIAQPQLVITKAGPAYAFVGAPVRFEIVVRNTGVIPATNVIVRDQVPPQLQPQQASEGGVIQGDTAVWNLGTLQPNEQRVLQLMTQAMQTGTNVCNVAVASADAVSQQSPPVCLEIRGIPGLLTELIDRYDPAPVGGETTYAIRLINQGSLALNGVKVVCELPAELQLVDAEPAGFQASEDGRVVTFGPFENFEAGKRLLMQVQAKAIRPGKARFRILVHTTELDGKPLIQEESTTIYDPATGEIDGTSQSRPRNEPTTAPASAPEEEEAPSAQLPPTLDPMAVASATSTPSIVVVPTGVQAAQSATSRKPAMEEGPALFPALPHLMTEAAGQTPATIAP